MASHTAGRCVLVFMTTMLVAAVDSAAVTPVIPNSMDYIGVGYNLVMGNPEGDSANLGGADPGLHGTRKILELTYRQNKKTKDNRFSVPDEVEYVPRDTEYTTDVQSIFSGAKSYANSLSNLVQESASLNAVFASVKFAGSHDYKKIAKDQESGGNVYFTKETITNFGSIRYMSELAKADGFNITRSFYAAICDLPATYEANTQKYMDFIDRWGTHVVMELDAGMRSGSTNRTTTSSFIKQASKQNSDSLSFGGHYKIASASVSVDISRFNADKTSQEKFESTSTAFQVGTLALQEPINLKLIGLNELLADDRYWTSQKSHEGTVCPVGWDRTAMSANLLKAYTGYIEYKKITPATQDPEVRVPIVWPDGTYALPKPARYPSGTCPNTEYMTWNEGDRSMRFMEFSVNQWTASQHLSDQIFESAAKLWFCVKDVEQVSPDPHAPSWDWMPGTYCIYKYGASCPREFTEGYLKYTERAENNNILQNGMLPEGIYRETSSQFYFCCRNDASPMHPIYLPTETSFYLFRYSQTCQQVHGMTVKEETLKIDTAYINNADEKVGAYPQPNKDSNPAAKHTIETTYCYYEPDTTAGAAAKRREELEANKKQAILQTSHDGAKEERRFSGREEVLKKFLDLLREE
ncbi:uncharacterized protein LOC121418993 [Lytechinus variegatus]|uniref:uncharacterized protein LOC121418993 n=1 Tax=Lytechinus variegatus TaxID=7654 RepID=UPI001BB208FA|nr:uncharacterized protein LOC121418993 [Lytechinus variegatus]